MKFYIKLLIWGIVNFIARFAVGGVLYKGGMDPVGFLYGALLTLTALIVAYVLARFVMKPATQKEAWKIGIVWVLIALVLDMVTAEPIVGVTVGLLLSELQTWTRLAAIVVGVMLGVKK